MSAITIKVQSRIIIQAENEALLPLPFQDRYRRSESRMRLMREISALIERYGDDVEQQRNDAGENLSQNRILADLATLGHKTAESIFGKEWENFWAVLHRHPLADIKIHNDENTWIPWELLSYCQGPEASGPYDFIARERNVYRVSPQREGVSVSQSAISEAGLLAHSKVRDDEYRSLEQVDDYCTNYPSHDLHEPENRAAALEDLIEWLRPLDLVHIAGIIVPLQHSQESWLLIDRDFHLSVEDLRRSVGRSSGKLGSGVRFAFDRNPLVILNVRDNYYRDPQHILRFVRFFLKSKAVGVIASELPIPPQLAAEFTDHFYRNLVRNGKPLGQVLAGTKSALLDAGNPFAMFYAPYFDPSTTIEVEGGMSSRSTGTSDSGKAGTVAIGKAKESPMTHETYADFHLHIGPDGHALARSEEGERKATISLDIPDDVGLTMELIEHNKTSETLLKKLGGILYRTVFPAPIDTHFNQTEAVARREGRKVRIRLTIEPEKLAQLPWEFMYREERGYVLAINPDTVLSHYLNLSMPPGYVRRGDTPLHMLAIIADPTDQTRLPPDEWEAIIKDALAGPMTSGQMTLHTVKHATRKEISNALLQQKPDIIQFVGHGIYQDGKGYLALVDAGTKKSWLVDDEQFANLYLGHGDHLGLISLATCESAKSDNPQGFLGIAPKLVERGVPAVLAMRYKVRIQTAKVFLEDFYSAVAARKPIDWATQSARKAISQELGFGNREFATPVLFMRAKDGNIF